MQLHKENVMPPSKKQKPVSGVSITAWARLMRVSQALLARVEASLKQEGMPPLAWYDALLELERVHPKGLRPFELQQEMLLAQYNTSRLTDRLVNAAYAERRECPGDGRGHVLHITASGRRLLRRMWPDYQAAIDLHFASRLTQAEAATLSGILTKLRDPSPTTPSDMS